MRNVHTYEPMVDGLINKVLKRSAYCAQSWQAGVWMYDAAKAACVFYTASMPLKENARSRNYGPFKTKNKKHEAKIIKYMQIETVYTTANYVLVDWHTPDMDTNETLQISRPAFEQWLYETCRLDWCLHEVTDREHDKSMSPANYWLYGDYGVTLQDVHTYIAEHGFDA